MQIKPYYLINNKTVMFKGFYFETGELYTEVIEEEDRFLVAHSPLKIIKHTLLCCGADFYGDGINFRQILFTGKKLYPIKVNESLEILLFPTKTQGCIWFVPNHIQRSEYDEMQQISIVPKRCHLTELRTENSSHTNNLFSFIVQPKKGS